MIKKFFLAIIFISNTFSFPPLPAELVVTNTLDSGSGSLRAAIVQFNKFIKKWPGAEITFRIPGISHAQITLESNIIIEPGASAGWIGNCYEATNSITITGRGSLIIKSKKIIISPRIEGNLLQNISEPEIVEDLQLSDEHECLIS